MGQTAAPRSPASQLESARVSLRSAEPMRALEEVCSAPRADRIQHRGRRQRQQRQPAQPRGHRSLKMHHPACWIVFSVTTALLFIPGTQQGLSAPPGRFRAEGEGEGEPGGGERE
ncbi:hypothetical protein J1605_022558 [Eschrichtius robustus]|uniref:Uncharacterized protein n=1 Tax=Eschrichtius robustus TaxID=9764 RepID=A0AB34H9M2_ESCRO|nr:hypothetical protein J1605_022558 [Eschrichtius robustus]